MRPGTPQAGNRVAATAIRVAALFFYVVLFAINSGCEAGPPVQEMSDARQAISIAKEAGAAAVAPDDLSQAEALLNSAQKNLADRAYAQARRDAMRAKEKALHALAVVERPE